MGSVDEREISPPYLDILRPPGGNLLESHLLTSATFRRGDVQKPAGGLRNGTGTDDISSEWTFSNKFGLSTGARADAGLCDPEGRKRKRIDHIWVRYETSDGTAITQPSSAWVDAQIVEPAVDRGWYDPPSGDPVKYSDHRMMHARFSWCGAQSGGFATPCS